MNLSNDLFLVVGHKGMLGSDLLRALEKRGAKSYGVDLDDLDISKESQVIDRISELAPTWVFNTAALTDVDGCESRKEEAYLINGHGPGFLAKACASIGAGLTHISTDYVFDGARNVPYKEDSPTSPICVYGKSKFLGELNVKEALPDSHCIVRTEWLFGLNGKNFVEAILKQTDKAETLKVVNDQVGAPTYTVDLADALVDLWENNALGIFNVTNSGMATWFDFAREILAIAGLDPGRVLPMSSSELNRPAKRPAYSVLDCSKQQSVTQKAMPHWKEALDSYMNDRESRTYMI